MWQALTTGEGLANWFPPAGGNRFVIPELNDALLVVERKGLETEYRLGIWLSLYDVPRDHVLTLERCVASLGERLAVRSTAAASSRSS